MLVQIVPGRGEPADCVRSFIFDANLYAQEASGDPAASSAPSRVVQRLQGSTESVTYLFGLTEDTPLEVGELGFPTIPAVEPSPELDFDGFIHISLPLLEETQNAEIECVLGADYLPLPGEELEPEALAVTRQLAEHAMALARQFGRSVAQIGMLYPAEADYSYDPFSTAYTELGFQPKHSEHQMFIEFPDSPARPFPVAGRSFHVFADYDIPEHHLDDILDLLTVASTDAVYGDLNTEPINWTRERLAEAHSRLRARKSHTLLIAVEEEGRIVALTELARHHDADPEVCEWTLTVTARDRRRAGLAMSAKLHALHEVSQWWPDTRRAYCSVADADPAMIRIYQHLGAEVISTSSAWELKL
ncbi:GNAT family acetyltransferase [Corynebacterium sp. HMSC06C06]|uniref:GNAT family N-acetyltransferase n=1 Tax=Corynebacterium striatum TaxID=43770 RepID=UPI0008A62BA6|nr:GNAT family N-acetyltransferase [Corynebacterium striatum]MDK8811753.1 GNAT family acetyltransferase [Corynebacterium striatum]OFT50564.1 GNAT family acetyltransferase [Corynebacterium sp. HMSC06C06]